MPLPAPRPRRISASRLRVVDGFARVTFIRYRARYWDFIGHHHDISFLSSAARLVKPEGVAIAATGSQHIAARRCYSPRCRAGAAWAGHHRPPVLLMISRLDYQHQLLIRPVSRRRKIPRQAGFRRRRRIGRGTPDASTVTQMPARPSRQHWPPSTTLASLLADRCRSCRLHLSPTRPGSAQIACCCCV